MKIICLKGLEIQQNVMWLFCDNTYFLLLSLFSSHLFRKSQFIFHQSPPKLHFFSRTIKVENRLNLQYFYFELWLVLLLWFLWSAINFYYYKGKKLILSMEWNKKGKNDTFYFHLVMIFRKKMRFLSCFQREDLTA